MMPAIRSQYRLHPGACAGITLIEMLVTLAIAVVVVGVGIPSFTSYSAGQKLRTASLELSSTLLFARSEAIKRNSDVVVTPAADGWDQGWTVTVGLNTLRAQEAMPGVSITTDATSLTYANSGRLKDAAAPTFDIAAGEGARCVAVNLSGMPNTRKGSCS